MSEQKIRDTDDRLSPVYIATYDHTGAILWGIDKFTKALKVEVEKLDKYLVYRTGWDHEAYTYDYLAENSPELLDEMKKALEKYKGRLGIGSSTYGQPLSAFINEESNVRQLTLAKDTVERYFGYPMTVYLMSEHAMHAQIPQLIQECGFTQAILRTHFMMYGQPPCFDEPIGWWTGMDGSSIPAVPDYKGHIRCGEFPAGIDDIILTWYPSEVCPDTTLYDFRRRFGDKIRPLLATRADDTRESEEVIAVHEKDPAFSWLLIEDIFKVMPSPRVHFNTAPKDFYTRMPWGYCGNWIWNRCGEAETRVLIAERLCAINFALGGLAYEENIEKAWKELLISQHHDVQICGLEDNARGFLDNSLKISNELIDKAMKNIGLRIGKKEDGNRTVVFNPLPWKRTDFVEAEEAAGAVSVPALGFRTVEAENRPNEVNPNTFSWKADEMLLETPFYNVRFGNDGGIKDLSSKTTGETILGTRRPSGALAGVVNGSYCESVGTVSKAVLSKEKVEIFEQGDIGGIPYCSKWTFYRHTTRIDWSGELDFDEQLVGNLSRYDAKKNLGFEHESKIRIRLFPLVSADAVGIHDVPFGITETKNKNVEGVYWSAISDGTNGLAVFNKGLMGSIREEADGAFSTVLAFSLPYVWRTRILKGKYKYELALMPFKGDWSEADLHRKAMEYNYPLITARVQDTREILGEEWSPFADKSRDALLSALYVKSDTIYARFFENAGKTANVEFDWMGRAARLGDADMRGNIRSIIGNEKKLGPWQIQTIAIR